MSYVIFGRTHLRHTHSLFVKPCYQVKTSSDSAAADFCRPSILCFLASGAKMAHQRLTQPQGGMAKEFLQPVV